MELITSWEEKGIQEGIKLGIEQGIEQGIEKGIARGEHQGKESLLAMQLERRFSTLPADFGERLDRLSNDQLNELGTALFDFESLAELDSWLGRNGS